MKRSAVAVWKGGPGAGEGSVSTPSGVINKVLYSFSSGTGNEPCTSPSEMLAAAVASCTSLMVAQEMVRAGIHEDYVQTECVLTLEEHKNRWEIGGVELNVTSTGPAELTERFLEACKKAKHRCPISSALKVPIKLTAALQPLAEAVSAR